MPDPKPILPGFVQTKRKTFDIVAECILVKTSIGVYSGRRKVEELSEEIETNHKTADGVADAFLRVLPKEVPKEIQKIASAARQELKLHSHPWDTGWFLIRATEYDNLRTSLEESKRKFDALVKKTVIDGYGDLEQKARKALNGLFATVGFPTKEELKKRYYFEIKRQPLADPNDIRLKHLPASAIREIQMEVSEVYKQKIVAAQENLMERLRQAVARVRATMTADKDGKDKTFRDSLINNIKELLEIVPTLNLLGDPKIEGFCERIKSELAGLKPDDLRKDKALREKTEKVAASLLNDLKAYTPTDDL
jgi:hypothetical protein